MSTTGHSAVDSAQSHSQPLNSNSMAPQETVDVTLGSRTVQVPKGGFYDRFRMNGFLDEIAKDPRVQDVEFFRQLPKIKVDSLIGPTYTPNFYYRMSSARFTMIAPSRAIRARLPRELSPLEVAPGLGLISVMVFRYDVCDIDYYTEAAVGVPVQPARHGPLGVVDLAAALNNDHLHSYVLSLPVNTEIAQVCGHDGYGFPKWMTEIDIDIDDQNVTGRIANETGGTDLALIARTPRQTGHRTGEKVSSLTSYTTINGAWHSTLSQTNALKIGGTSFPRDLSLQLGQGRMSDDLRSLKPLRTIRLDVVTDGQLALHMPVPYSVPNAG